MSRIKYSYTKPGERRKHYLEGARRRGVARTASFRALVSAPSRPFQRQGGGNRRLGYVNRGRREIAICALPPNVSVSRFLIRHRQSCLVRFGGSNGLRLQFDASYCTTCSFTSWGIFRLSIPTRTLNEESLPVRRRRRSLPTSGVLGCGLNISPTPIRSTIRPRLRNWKCFRASCSHTPHAEGM